MGTTKNTPEEQLTGTGDGVMGTTKNTPEEQLTGTGAQKPPAPRGATASSQASLPPGPETRERRPEPFGEEGPSVSSKGRDVESE